ncbi:hypothetical protein Tsubulata_046083 [Turnera subulata]|uniref:BED-type domain-containing protein n=1 Tax=Turnera subulata TaxID=218843 RepID=A0A9Q0J4L4_9ROSI|nr:hypothetical protein Tsubulata_046083 [Turnera subulata]
MESQSKSSTSVSARGKSDPAWEHIALSTAADGTKVYTCLFCEKEVRGGGINRLKQHLAGIPGSITACKKVDHDVRYRMSEYLKEISGKKKEASIAKRRFQSRDGDNDGGDDDDEPAQPLALASTTMGANPSQICYCRPSSVESRPDKLLKRPIQTKNHKKCRLPLLNRIQLSSIDPSSRFQHVEHRLSPCLCPCFCSSAAATGARVFNVISAGAGG